MRYSSALSALCLVSIAEPAVAGPVSRLNKWFARDEEAVAHDGTPPTVVTVVAPPEELTIVPLPEPEDLIPEPEDLLPELEDLLPEPEDLLPKPEDLPPKPEDLPPKPEDLLPKPEDPIPAIMTTVLPAPEVAPQPPHAAIVTSLPDHHPEVIAPIPKPEPVTSLPVPVPVPGPAGPPLADAAIPPMIADHPPTEEAPAPVDTVLPFPHEHEHEHEHDDVTDDAENEPNHLPAFAMKHTPPTPASAPAPADDADIPPITIGEPPEQETPIPARTYAHNRAFARRLNALFAALRPASRCTSGRVVCLGTAAQGVCTAAGVYKAVPCVASRDVCAALPMTHSNAVTVGCRFAEDVAVLLADGDLDESALAVLPYSAPLGFVTPPPPPPPLPAAVVEEPEPTPFAEHDPIPAPAHAHDEEPTPLAVVQAVPPPAAAAASAPPVEEPTALAVVPVDDDDDDEVENVNAVAYVTAAAMKMPSPPEEMTTFVANGRTTVVYTTTVTVMWAPAETDPAEDESP